VYTEDDFLPLSGLQHMIFCDRQAALIHVQGIWLENALTVEGGQLHRVVDEAGPERRDRIRICRGLRIASERLVLSGRSDVVEFHRHEQGTASAVDLDGYGGLWVPLPIEYKRGQPKNHRADEVQLCAQAMCLEEEFDTEILEGSLFYGRPRRRTRVLFEPELRDLTERTAHRFHEMVHGGVTPVRYREAKCRRCSLLPECLPPKRRAPKSANDYMRARIDAELQREM